MVDISDIYYVPFQNSCKKGRNATNGKHAKKKGRKYMLNFQNAFSIWKFMQKKGQKCILIFKIHTKMKKKKAHVFAFTVSPVSFLHFKA